MGDQPASTCIACCTSGNCHLGASDSPGDLACTVSMGADLGLPGAALGAASSRAEPAGAAPFFAAPVDCLGVGVGLAGCERKPFLNPLPKPASARWRSDAIRSAGASDAGALTQGTGVCPPPPPQPQAPRHQHKSVCCWGRFRRTKRQNVQRVPIGASARSAGGLLHRPMPGALPVVTCWCCSGAFVCMRAGQCLCVLGGGGHGLPHCPPQLRHTAAVLPHPPPAPPEGAFSHSVGTAPIMTLFIPGTPPAHHPPTEACMAQSKQHQGCKIQDPGTRDYRRWKTADFLHSAGTAPITTLFVPGSPLQTTPLQKRA